MKKILLGMFFLFGMVPFIFADTIVLKEGDRYQGKIVYEGENKIHLQMEIGLIKFDRDEIATILEDSPIPSPSQKKEFQESLPFPKNKKRAPRKRLAPRKRPSEYRQPVKSSLPVDQDRALTEQKRALDFKEKELELKKRELELRRRELELKKKETSVEERKNELVEQPSLKPASVLQPEPEEKNIPEPLPEPEPQPEPVAPKEEPEEEDLKSKGYTITPQIRGSGRYKTY